MRSNTAFFPVFVLVSLLPACNSIEKKVEQKAEAAVEERVLAGGTPLTGGVTLTKGVCAGWPSSVPVEPGARDVFCQTMDPKAVVNSPQFKLWLATHPEDRPTPGAKPEIFPQTFMLTFDVDVSEDDVDAFYRKNLKESLPAPSLPMPVPMTPLLSRDPTAADPLMFVMRIRSLESNASTTKVALMVWVATKL